MSTVRSALFALFVLAAPPEACARSSTSESLLVRDATIHYQVIGNGPSVVLLHGGLFGSIDEYAALIPELARTHRVIAIETRGHGRSGLGGSRLSYALFAADAASIIRATGGGPVDVIGFSDGAITGYYLAADWPSLVRRVVAIGGPLGISGYSKVGLSELDKYDSVADLAQHAPDFVAARQQLMPDPTLWPRLVSELSSMWHQDEYISRERVRSIRCPVLLMAGDRDEYVRAEHLLEIHRLLPHSELAIIPDAGHTVLALRPVLAHGLISHFLDQP